MKTRVLALTSLIALGAAACGTVIEPSAESSESDILRGTDAANDPMLSGVVWIQVDGRFVCSGTLIAPELVLTARHCLASVRSYSVSVVTNRTVGDGKLGQSRAVRNVLHLGPVIEDRHMGIDSALLTLESPFDADRGVRPIPVRTRPLDASDVGKSFVTAGYGMTKGSQASDYRPTAKPLQKTTLELQAVRGKPFHALFPNKAAFVDYITKLVNAEAAERAADDYDMTLSAKHYEVYAGMGPNDGQACSGDSGGPLLERVGDHYEVVGLLSWGFFGDARTEHPCMLGSVYVAIGPKLQDAVSKSNPPPPTPAGFAAVRPPTWVSCTAASLAAAKNGRPEFTGTCTGTIHSRCGSHSTYSYQYIDDCADNGLVCKAGPGCSAP